MRTTYADGIRCLNVCAKGKLAEGHVFQRKILKEFAARMNESTEIDVQRQQGIRNATKNGMACSQEEAENETICNSTCAPIESGRLRQTYELCYLYAGKHGG
ncbi:hypothetical protein AVEN_201630-1 [Araneus ventricosus]|uniref:Uncharacterized protein n=1 Tax=Araneus ventricosus TaxID=182803 RepID=A0A4Y2LIL8_ARAVE|nr:hypothetical protein AVEN_201630-1 [Araneus ventricosus]